MQNSLRELQIFFFIVESTLDVEENFSKGFPNSNSELKRILKMPLCLRLYGSEFYSIQKQETSLSVSPTCSCLHYFCITDKMVLLSSGNVENEIQIPTSSHSHNAD